MNRRIFTQSKSYFLNTLNQAGPYLLGVAMGIIFAVMLFLGIR